MSDKDDLNKHDMSLYLPAVRGIIRRSKPAQRTLDKPPQDRSGTAGDGQ